MPLLISVMALLICLMQVFYLQMVIQNSLRKVTRELSLYPQIQVSAAHIGALTELELMQRGISPKWIQGSWLGITYSKSQVDPWEIHAVAEYQIKIPLPFLALPGAKLQASASQRRWSGWNPKEKQGDGENVYVTKHGVAYHRDLGCPYLNPKLHSVRAEDLPALRNQSGARYHNCPVCHARDKKKEAGAHFYVAEEGLVYHAHLNCASLRRHINRIRIAEAISRGYHACPRCGGDRQDE